MSQTVLFSITRGSLAGLALGLVVFGWVIPHGANPVFWWLSRSAGITAYGLLWLNVVSGLLLSGRWLRDRLAPALIAQVHQTLSGMALGFSLFHALILLADRHLGLSWKDLLLPFAADFAPQWMVAGQLALALMGALILTTALRRRLGNAAWRAIHLTAYGAYWLALAHALAIGTDAFELLVLYGLTGASVLLLTTARILLQTGTPQRRERPSQQAATHGR